MRLLKKINSSFAVQLVIFLFFVSLVIFLLMFITNTMMARKVMIKNAELIASNLTTSNINKIEGILAQTEEMTINLSYLVSSGIITGDEQNGYLPQMLNHDQELQAICIAYTQEYLRSHPGLSSVIYYHDNTGLRSDKIIPEQENYEIEDWFIIPKDRKKTYWSEPWVDAHGGAQPVTSCSVPIYRNMQIIGVVRTDMSLMVLQHIVSSMRLLKTGYAILITSNGTFVTHPADSLILNYSIFSYAEQTRNSQLKQIGTRMVKGEDGFYKLPGKNPGLDEWIYFAPISVNGWSVGVRFSGREIMRDLNKVNYFFTLILGLGLILLLLTIYTRLTTIFKPLNTLVKAADNIGGGNFEVKLPASNKGNEVSLLTASFARMQAELKTYTENLINTTREKDKIAAEIKFAAQIQQKIVPTNQNLLTNVREVSIYGILEPAEDIGGDFYDAFMIDDQHLCFLIADVFGKGIVASMLMTMVQTLIRSQSRHSTSAVKLVRDVNSYLCEYNKQSNFVTIIVGILDLKTGIVEFCNAGHPPIYLKRPRQDYIRLGETHTTALGIFDDLKIESSRVQIDAQDMMILFTDGITEAMSEDEMFFGFGRVESIISEMQNPTPEGMAKAILNGVRNFSGISVPRDDLSILVIKLNHPRF